MHDQNVPAHWRLLGILNGFFANHKDVYASNAWFQEQLNCSQKTVSDAVRYLEELGIIKCERTLNSRLIKRGDSSQLLGGVQPTTMPHSSQLLPNSDSNAESKKHTAPNGALSPLPVVEVPLNEKEPRVPRDKRAWDLREWCYKKIKEDTGAYPTPSMADYKRIQAALKHLDERGVKEMMEEAIDNGKGQTVRGVFTDREIDIYRQQNA